MQGDVLHHEFPPDLFLAHLQLARAYRAINDRNDAFVHYQHLIRMLQNADDIPVYNLTKREAAQFGSEVKPVTRMFLTPSKPERYTGRYFRGGRCYEQQPVDNHRERDRRRLLLGTTVQGSVWSRRNLQVPVDQS